MNQIIPHKHILTNTVEEARNRLGGLHDIGQSCSLRIDDPGAVEYRLAYDWLKALLWDEVNRSIKERCQFLLNLGQGEEADLSLRHEINQEVDVTLVAKIIAERRTEQGKLADRILGAKIPDGIQRQTQS